MVAFHFMQSCEMYMCQEAKKEKKKKQKTESYNKLYHGIALGGKKTYLLLDA